VSHGGRPQWALWWNTTAKVSYAYDREVDATNDLVTSKTKSFAPIQTVTTPNMQSKG